mgnify:CR=1 FL=1
MYHFKIYGNNSLLSLPKIAIHASRSAEDSLVASAETLFQGLLKQKIAIGSGWHSKLEKILLTAYPSNAIADVLIFIAKNFEHYKLPGHLALAYSRDKIAIVEPDVNRDRIEKEGVQIRDQIIDDLIDRHLFLYIHPGGQLEKRFWELLNRGKKVFVLNHALNERFLIKGVSAIDTKLDSTLNFLS